ncbi:MAG: bifunctional proline dehydrogenase/L-glutamate gamma-semialdehyde dehydrogenase PutA, partial [Pseudomonadales bacterium]|nr:bifunctional proline dehydrogenase/L-glutamate gamma-semialdehyde dehydrogenase PutA [Pseudomonadales bacterium]
MANDLQAHRDRILDAWIADEPELVQAFSSYVQPSENELRTVTESSVRLIERIRKHSDFNKGLDAFMAEYSLDSIEGIRLMTLAEALARIPDEDTKEALIRSKLTGVDWSRHVGKSVSPFVNSSTRALLFTSSVLESEEIPFLSEIVRRVGEPAIRMAIELGMGIFSDHFVLGETLEEAKRKIKKEAKQYRYSFDMLGEAALTSDDATRFFDSYQEAIRFAGEFPNSAVSIKLSALHPRYEANQASRVHNELYPALDELIRLARDKDVQITIDAEEMDRLDLSLDIFERLVRQGAGKGFEQLGLAVQAYAKRGMAVLEYLKALSEHCNQRICVRLVKGAYWDTEVKYAQLLGLDDYPVFTVKSHTDISFLACAKYMIANDRNFYSQFATHNVHSVANLLHWTRDTNITFEFQRLHGMGAVLYDCLLEEFPDVDCCIYAPIGRQKELLPYLIRRLLENSANSSFVNQLASNTDPRELSRHPVEIARTESSTIVRPPDLYLPTRDNSRGINLRFEPHKDQLLEQVGHWKDRVWSASPSQETSEPATPVYSPMGHHEIGAVAFADEDTVAQSVACARSAVESWRRTPEAERSKLIDRVADLLEENREELITLMGMEGGKTLDDGIAEVREAVDFCRYYANQMHRFTERHNLPGPNGEVNELYYEPRGVFACISPWNFPVAIFTGQIAAALVTGNTVIAKPAEQTCLVAGRVCELMHEAGVPDDVLQLLTGEGDIGAALVESDIDGV